MEYIKFIPKLCLDNPIACAKYYNDCGADEIACFDSAASKEGREPDISLIRELTKVIDVPLLYCGGIKNIEDVKKVLYAGVDKICIKTAAIENPSLISEISDQFGSERIIITIDTSAENAVEWAIEAQNLGAGQLLLIGTNRRKYISVVKKVKASVTIPVIITLPYNKDKDAAKMLKETKADAISIYTDEMIDVMYVKQQCADQELPVNIFESAIDFDEFKLDANGLIPTIVQHYKTGQVLMLAYMNKESYEKTIRTGKMTYWSRSRQELWTKGDTSGHYQYVKSLSLDCDNDTILAKVSQIGPACHTGSTSCFFKTLLTKDFDDTNPLTVLEDVYNSILEQRDHPIKGSYANYLFDKGIDKILNKLGEEAISMIVASKNADQNEMKYEMSDYLYHMMVLMAEQGINWKEILQELSERR